MRPDELISSSTFWKRSEWLLSSHVEEGEAAGIYSAAGSVEETRSSWLHCNLLSFFSSESVATIMAQDYVHLIPTGNLIYTAFGKPR